MHLEEGLGFVPIELDFDLENRTSRFEAVDHRRMTLLADGTRNGDLGPVRTGAADLDLRGRLPEFTERKNMAVDVPRFEIGRFVGIRNESSEWLFDRNGLAVDFKTRDGSRAVDGDGNSSVGQSAIGRRDDFGFIDDQGLFHWNAGQRRYLDINVVAFAGRLDPLADGDGQRIEDTHRAGFLFEGMARSFQFFLRNAVEFGQTFGIDVPDGTAGDVVVELGKHHPLPRFLGHDTSGDGSNRFAHLQGAFEGAEGGFQRAVGGERSAVIFEIALALINRQTVANLVETFEESFRLIPRNLRHARQGAQAAGAFAHIVGRAATAVAVTGRQQIFVMHIGLLVAIEAVLDVFHFHVGDITDVLADVGDDFRPVDAAPDKAAVGEAIDRVPGHLGGEEMINAAQLHQLRQATGITEDVRQPRQAGRFAVDADETFLAEDKTPGQCFATGKHRIGFDIHSTGRLPTSRANALLNGSVQRRSAAGNGFVTGRLGIGKFELGIFAHQVIDRREDVNRLQLAHALGPEPDQIDVRVTGQDAMLEGLVAAQFLVGFRQLYAHRLRAVGVKHVDGFVHQPQQTAVERRYLVDRSLQSRAVERRRKQRIFPHALVHHDVEKTLQIVVGVPGVLVAFADKGTVEAAAVRGQSGCAGMPDTTLDAVGINPAFTNTRGQFAVTVSHVETEIRRAVNIERRLGLVAPVEVQRDGRLGKFDVAPTLVVEFAPAGIREHFKALEFLSFGERNDLMSGHTGIDPQRADIAPGQGFQTSQRGLRPIRDQRQ